jgi:hypothetical protein
MITVQIPNWGSKLSLRNQPAGRFGKPPTKTHPTRGLASPQGNEHAIYDGPGRDGHVDGNAEVWPFSTFL